MNQNTPAPEGLPDDAKRRPDHGPAVGTGDACTGSVAVNSSTSPPRNSTISIPDHELLRRIGGGSYGEVWLARNVMGTFRAVKIVYRKSFDHDRPFEREFKGIQKFEPISRSHEGLVDILQIGRNDQAGHFYYVMELADDATGESEKVGKRGRRWLTCPLFHFLTCGVHASHVARRNQTTPLLARR